MSLRVTCDVQVAWLSYCMYCIKLCECLTQGLEAMANALHVMTWSPRDWMEALHWTVPDDVTINWWLIQLAAVTHCYRCSGREVESRNAGRELNMSQLTVVSNSLRSCFLSRASARDVHDVLTLLHKMSQTPMRL